MDVNYIINQLEINKSIFSSLFLNLNSDQIEWKQDLSKWSFLDIICHLYDEEREDFRARLKSTLEDPSKELEPIDPENWVTTRKYSEQSFEAKLSLFIAEREKSIEYLKNLDTPKWGNAYVHPKFGKLSAKMFFTNWLAHDYLHIKQIIKLKFDYLKSISGEQLNYAGDW